MARFVGFADSVNEIIGGVCDRYSADPKVVGSLLELCKLEFVFAEVGDDDEDFDPEPYHDLKTARPTHDFAGDLAIRGKILGFGERIQEIAQASLTTVDFVRHLHTQEDLPEGVEVTRRLLGWAKQLLELIVAIQSEVDDSLEEQERKLKDYLRRGLPHEADSTSQTLFKAVNILERTLATLDDFVEWTKVCAHPRPTREDTKESITRVKRRAEALAAAIRELTPEISIELFHPGFSHQTLIKSLHIDILSMQHRNAPATMHDSLDAIGLVVDTCDLALTRMPEDKGGGRYGRPTKRAVSELYSCFMSGLNLAFLSTPHSFVDEPEAVGAQSRLKKVWKGYIRHNLVKFVMAAMKSKGDTISEDMVRKYLTAARKTVPLRFPYDEE